MVRPASPADAPAIRTLLVATWHATYDGILGSAKVTEITDRWHAVDNLVRQAEMAAHAPERHVFLVAEGENGLDGTVSASMAEPEVVTLARLYVRPQAQRKGLGRALFQASLAPFADTPLVRLEVHPQNKGAIRFYEHCGFAAVNAGQACGGDGVAAVDHLIMEWPRNPPPTRFSDDKRTY